ncbi:MAG TPA: YncE family protein [Bryobacteraceae bacterium]|nr:YncE family protein [Bryobacteraceae bacterium]
MTRKLIIAALALTVAYAAEGFKVINKIKIGGTGGWDYVAVDPDANRVYASHGTLVEVVDLKSGKVVGQITQLHGVHGVAVAPEFGKGFITNGQSNSVTIFDLKTLAKVGEPQTGQNPDSVCFEPKTKHIFTFNGRSNDSTAIDPSTNEVIKSFPLGGKPEECAVDGTGKIYVNLEDSSEILEIDAAKTTVLRHVSLSPCESPSGLAIDVKNKKLFSACDNKVMAVTDIPTLKVIATPAIGPGTDGAGFDSGLGLAFSSNGGDGTLSIVKQVNGKYETVDNVTTERGARTMTVDSKNHRVYLLAAEYGPAPEASGGKKGRPPILPDSFHILVVGK